MKKVIKMPPGSFNLSGGKEQLPKFTLGPPPWSEKELKKAFFSNWEYTTETIRKLPGFAVHQTLHTLQLSLDIFRDSVRELLESIRLFQTGSASKQYWGRPNQKRLQKLELSIRRGVFVSATSAMALVEHSRNAARAFSVPGYHDQVGSSFDNNKEHRFIHSLRRYVSHWKMIETNWVISWSATSGRKCQVLFQHDKLMTWDDWDRLSKDFINKHPDGIDVEVLFRNYLGHVENFHRWFHGELKKVSEPELSEYRKYEQMLTRFEVKAFANVALKEMVIGKIDPYEHLDRFLTKSEIDEVLRLPKRSTEQVDKIIEILDEWNASDEELRQTIYTAFGVKTSPKKPAY